MDFRIFRLMTFLAERLQQRSNSFFNEINFVTKEYDKVLLEYSKKNKPEVYGGLADNRQNYGYVRFLFNKVEYNSEREKFKGSKGGCNLSYDNFQYYIDIEIKIVLIAWHIEHDILESWLRQTLFKISKEDSELFYKPPLKKTIELLPKSSDMNSYDVSLMELPKDKRAKGENPAPVIDGLTFYSMDVDVRYLWQHDDCNEIDLCNIKC